jgi:type II secretory pathway predicted ATPase ExeA
MTLDAAQPTCDRPRLGPDCFAPTADPDAYVPRLATERALRALEDAVLTGPDPILLQGVGGLGKTLLMRVLAGRLNDRLESVYLPFPTLSRSDLCAMALGLLDRPAAGDPEERLVAAAESLQAGGSGLLLLVDDAGSLPADSARGLASLAHASDGALRMVLAVEDDASVERLNAAAGRRLPIVHLGGPMSAGETGQYVRRRLGRLLGREAARRIEPAAIAEIHRASEGVPRRVHAVIDRLRLRVDWPQAGRSPARSEPEASEVEQLRRSTAMAWRVRLGSAS